MPTKSDSTLRISTMSLAAVSMPEPLIGVVEVSAAAFTARSSVICCCVTMLVMVATLVAGSMLTRSTSSALSSALDSGVKAVRSRSMLASTPIACSTGSSLAFRPSDSALSCSGVSEANSPPSKYCEASRPAMLATTRSVSGVMLMVPLASAAVAAEWITTRSPATVPSARKTKGAVMPLTSIL
ncbi:hypothetical protein [Variovorax paradoxus]|uniref:hypothetical protein n=1 Tax=Variovorax paradoxus TaxID=34073 RepID=UPI001F3EF343|nr:hypothetical protein [Variovorax paradoxus]UKI05509.1 hypothetical protein L3V85_22050 [Variovorax paradoxus]